MVLTRLIEHLVTLIENKVLEVSKAHVLIADERIDTTGRSNDDVRMGVLVGEKFDVFLDRCTAVEDANLYVGQELGETVVLIANLIGQLAGVAHNQNACDAGLGLLLHLLQSCKDKDSGLSKTGLGLAEDIVAENCLGDGNLLDYRAQCMSERVFKRSKQSAKRSVRPSADIEILHLMGGPIHYPICYVLTSISCAPLPDAVLPSPIPPEPLK